MTDMLSIGRSALLAYSGALATVGNNVANAHTPGYVRRAADLREMPPSNSQSLTAGLGVRAAGVQRQWNQFLADSARQDGSSTAREQIRYDGAKQIETAIDDGVGGIGQSMTGFFNAAQALSGDPASAGNQAQLRHSLDAATATFRRSAAALNDVTNQRNGQVDAALNLANEQLTQIASINQRIGNTRPNSSDQAALADQRDGYLNALAGSLGATAVIDDQGRATVTLGLHTDPALVSGSNAALLRRGDNSTIIATSDTGTHIATPVAGLISGLQATITQANDRRRDIDTLATDFVATVNAWSAQGRTSAGQAGLPLLSAQSAGDIATTPALGEPLPMADMAGSPNGNLLALGGIRRTSGLEQRWDTIVSRHAQSTASAKVAADASQALATASASKLDAAGSVDLDNEAADMIRYQQAYQAAARIIKAADDAVSAVLQLL